jgi:hypothetical protein
LPAENVDRQRLTLDILRRAARGGLTAEQAEAEATRLGIGPLACKPNVVRFDPMQEPFWTVPMAVAWIAWRTPNAVREMWIEYRKAFREWHFGRTRSKGDWLEGWHLEGRRPASMRDLNAYRENAGEAWVAQPSPTMQIAKSESALLAALAIGEVAASGISPESSLRRPIPAIEWLELERWVQNGVDFYGVRSAATRLDTADDFPKGRFLLSMVSPIVKYLDVRVDSAGITDLWPGAMLKAAPRTGAPGRPSSMHLIVLEFDRRIAAHQIEPSLKEQAAVLCDWLAANHPESPPAGPKTIENKIRKSYNAAKRP